MMTIDQKVVRVPIHVEQADIQYANVMNLFDIQQRGANIFRCAVMLMEPLQRTDFDLNLSFRLGQQSSMRDSKHSSARNLGTTFMVQQICSTFPSSSSTNFDSTFHFRVHVHHASKSFRIEWSIRFLISGLEDRGLGSSSISHDVRTTTAVVHQISIIEIREPGQLRPAIPITILRITGPFRIERLVFQDFWCMTISQTTLYFQNQLL
mmetsp:Transcript_41334/g.130054  ORF Transcript_41334/g.130054 Transcript_41334/m.130054 type:complete len:208 (-) Transcript_41334:2061-2684(-)